MVFQTEQTVKKTDPVLYKHLKFKEFSKISNKLDSSSVTQSILYLYFTVKKPDKPSGKQPRQQKKGNRISTSYYRKMLEEFRGYCNAM
jgi:hypothetical protein